LQERGAWVVAGWSVCVQGGGVRHTCVLQSPLGVSVRPQPCRLMLWRVPPDGEGVHRPRVCGTTAALSQAGQAADTLAQDTPGSAGGLRHAWEDCRSAAWHHGWGGCICVPCRKAASVHEGAPVQPVGLSSSTMHGLQCFLTMGHAWIACTAHRCSSRCWQHGLLQCLVGVSVCRCCAGLPTCSTHCSGQQCAATSDTPAVPGGVSSELNQLVTHHLSGTSRWIAELIGEQAVILTQLCKPEPH
jgi:hypothetical protein